MQQRQRTAKDLLVVVAADNLFGLQLLHLLLLLLCCRCCCAEAKGLGLGSPA